MEISPKRYGLPPGMILVFVLLASGIMGGGLLFNRAQEQQLKQISENELAAIGRLKMSQIVQWRNERLGNAGYIMESRFASKWLEKNTISRNPESDERIIRRFRGIQAYYPYYDITLVDSRGNVRLSLNGTLDELNNVTLEYLAVALREKKPVLTDLYYCTHSERPHLDVIAPLFKQEGDSITPLGAVILCIDAQQFLFPLVESWPTPCPTAETLLVRRDGDDVLYLNELRHWENTALKLKRPLIQGDLPASMAVQEKEGIVQGRDYRGVEVLAAVGPVPGSPWFMVAKVDAEEAFSALRSRTRLTMVLTFGLLAAMLTAAGLFWQQRQKEHYLTLYRAEIDRRALRKHFEHLVKYANDIILLMNREERIVEANERALAAYGYTREEMPGLPLTGLVAPQELASHEAAKREMVEKESALYETVHQRRDGSPFPVEVSARIIDIEGERYLQTIIRDITERKRAEARIEHLNLVLHAIRNVNQLIVHEKDPLKLIQDTCQLLVETRGYGGAMIVLTDGTDAPQTFVEAGIGEAFKPLAERLRQGKLPPCCEAARDEEEVFFVIDRSRICTTCPLALSCPPDDTMCIRLNHDGKAYGYLAVSVSRGLGRDDDERSLFTELAGDVAFALHNFELEKEARQVEKERRISEAKLQQAQKMEALGTLAGGIAHDFNNILGIIMGYTEIARWEAREDSPLRTQLQEVLKAANRATDLVKQILSFCRRGEQEKRPILTGPVVKETIKMLRASLPSTIEIKSEVSSKGTVLADPTQIHQVLMNLCTNAAHAMQDDGGLLEIDLSDVHLDPEAIKPHSDLQPGPYVQLSVRDTGHGIDPVIMDRIFDPFFTTKEPGVGTGLGLSVVHGVVESHGGTIEVESSPGKGTIFRVLFPAKENGAEAEREESAPLPQGRERVLVVDDEPALSMIVKQALELLGYQVEYRTSSIEALEAFRHQPPEKPFDLVVTDMTMPHMTGLDLTRELLRLQPDLPVILCTGFSEKANAEKAKNFGIRGFLMKPVVLRELAELVRKVLDQREK